jgi:hypothetical protein
VPARVAAVFAQSPFLRQVHHFAQNAQGAIGLIRAIAELVMKLSHISPEQVTETAASKCWADEKLD